MDVGVRLRPSGARGAGTVVATDQGGEPRPMHRNPRWHICEGPLPGLRLPVNAWEALAREDITSLDQLRSVADRVHQFIGIGPKTARIIREELARLPTGTSPPGKGGMSAP